jgi:hypothetical protein
VLKVITRGVERQAVESRRKPFVVREQLAAPAVSVRSR